MTLTPEDVRQTVRESPSAADGLLRVLARSGAYLDDDVAEALTGAVQMWQEREPHTAVIRELMQHWRDPRAQSLIVWELRQRAMRSLDREGKAFAGQPRISVHLIDMADDHGFAAGAALTDEQVAEQSDIAWIEIRLVVPVRELPEWVPSPTPVP